MDDTTIIVKKPYGILQILSIKINQDIADGKVISSDGKITSREYEKALDALDKINEAHKKNGNSIFKGPTERQGLKCNWHKNYVVYPGQEITFTQSEINDLYSALGLTIVNDNNKDEIESIPGNNSNDTAVVSVDTTMVKPSEPLEKPEEAVVVPVDTPAVRPTAPQEQQEEIVSPASVTTDKNNSGKTILGIIGVAVTVASMVYMAKTGKGKELITKFKGIFANKQPARAAENTLPKKTKGTLPSNHQPLQNSAQKDTVETSVGRAEEITPETPAPIDIPVAKATTSATEPQVPQTAADLELEEKRRIDELWADMEAHQDEYRQQNEMLMDGMLHLRHNVPWFDRKRHIF